MSIINISIADDVKKEFAALCKSRGITVSAALKMFIYAEIAKDREKKAGDEKE